MAKGNSNSLNNKSRSSKPYDVTNSFVKQVKDRMTSYLPRFGLFSPPAVEASEITTPAPINLNESSSEDDETSSQQFAPPKKRARSELNQPLPYENFANRTPSNLFLDRPSVLGFADGTIAGPSGISRRPCLATSTPAIHSRYPLEPNLIQASEPIANGDNDSNSSMSTSGCSSLIPQAKYQAENNKSSISVNNRSSQRRGCFGDKDISTVLQTSRSMLDGSAPRASSAASGRRPSFNASVFSASSTSPAAPDSAGRSPFYAGRTQFGGASSYRRPRGALFTPLDVGSPTPRQTVQVKALAGSSTLDWGSCTARKILDTLDHLSSPVLDAKRIPSSPVLGHRRKRSATEASPGPVRDGPATDELTIPTVQDLLKMQRQNRMRDSMEAARKVALSPALNPTPTLTETEKEYRLRLDADRERPTGGKMTSKMRSLEAEMSPVESRLPSVSLSIVGLPKFAQDDRTAKPSRFTFARPTPLSADEFDVAELKARVPAKKPPALNNNSVDVKSRVVVAQPAQPAAQFSTFSSSAKPRERSGFAEMSKAAGQNGKVGFAAAAELRTGSVMDILGKKPTSAPAALLAGFGSQFKPAAGSWTCDACLVSNVPTASKCVSCTTARPPPKTTPPPSFGAQFKPAAGSWSCDACMVQNKPDDVKCVSCTTARAPSKVAAPSFGSQFKPPAGSWTCDACMVPNKADAAACASCQTAKTPSKPAPFGNAFDSMPGFGVQFKAATGTWECDSCMVRNKPEATACVSCSAAAPKSAPAAEPPKLPTLGFGATFAAPAASWECSSCLVRNENASVACIACETRRPDVRGSMAKPAQPAFGITKSATTFGSLNTGFGITASTGGFGSNASANVFGSITSTSGFGSTSTAPSSATVSTVFGSAAPPVSAPVTFGAAPKVSGFGDAFKKSVGAWDCDACMVRNSSGDVCVACERPRPGCAPTASKVVPEPTPAPMFAFGVDKAGPGATAAPAVSFGFAASLPAPTGGFTFGVPAKAEPAIPKPAAPVEQSAPGSGDRKRKGNDEGDGPASKTGFGAFEPSKAAKSFAFGAPKSNGPVAPAANNLFAFGTPAAKPGPGFGAPAQTTNPFTATTDSAASSLFSAPTSSAAAATKTTSSFAPTANFFATASTEKPSSGLFGASDTSTPTTSMFAPTSNASTPAASPFTTATTSASSAVFAFGTAAPAKPAAAESAPKTVTFGSGFGAAKPTGGFGSLSTPSLGFPSTNAVTSAPAFGAPTAKPAASAFSAGTFVFGQAAKPAEKTFATFGQPAEQKGFNFSATPAPNVSTGFGFGALAPATSATFAFSAAPAAAPAAAFAFGQPTAFNPSAQPKFNFTGGEVPQFTAAGVLNPGTPAPRRIIKKAVRRAPR